MGDGPFVGYAGMLAYAAVWVLTTSYFAYAQWRRRRRLAAGYFPERYNEPRRPASPRDTATAADV
jgi:hypothetical protein